MEMICWHVETEHGGLASLVTTASPHSHDRRYSTRRKTINNKQSLWQPTCLQPPCGNTSEWGPRDPTVNSRVAQHNQRRCGVNVKMIRYHTWDRGLVAAFGSAFFYGLCRRAEQPDECGSPQEYNVMQLSLGNNRKNAGGLQFLWYC